MTRYRVAIARTAITAIAALPRKEQPRVRAAIDLLADTPRPPTCVALKGEPRAYRVRVGEYRLLYELFDDRLVILVVRVGQRREVHH